MAVKKKIDKVVVKPTFYKKQLIESERYGDYRDVLSVILNENEGYTLEEVDEKIDAFMKKECK